MQPLRLRKSQLLLISIVLALALIIATVVIKPPVNYGLIFRSSANASRSVSTTNANDNNLTKSAVVVRANRTYYIDTNAKSKNQLLNNKTVNNIALVAPTFTAAAYEHNSFYTFYNLYTNTSMTTNVTSNLNLLSHKITNNDMLRASLVMLKLVDNLKLINPNSHITILTDADVDNGSLFNNSNHKNNKNSSNYNNNIFGVAILGHQEYNNLKFV